MRNLNVSLWTLFSSCSHVPVGIQPIDLPRGVPILSSMLSQSQNHVSQLRVNNRDDNDIEMKQRRPNAESLPDPYTLRVGLKSDDELSQLRRRHKHGKSLESYHRKQNDVRLHTLLSIVRHNHSPSYPRSLFIHSSNQWPTTPKRPEILKRLIVFLYAFLPPSLYKPYRASPIQIKIAIWASLVANFTLCVLQLYAAISATSLSLIATGIDACFDLGSNVFLYLINKKAEKMDVDKWPVGGARLENIGNIIYGSLMSSVNLVVVVESIQALITHSSDTSFNLPSILAVAAALGVKIILFLYCHTLRSKSSQVHTLWEDHRNDIFINSFGILMSAGGSRLRWWLDPVGGVLIAAGVIIAWVHTIYKEFCLLAGKSAPNEFIQLVIYKAMTFSADIDKIDTVRAYHSGPDYFVEVDIVMDASTPLWKAHDVSQQLQDKLEELPNVERAFVHVDHETTHAPEHRKMV
ncbi:CDF manganese transporter [Butyriboletus roseoflavus]|nr:CDF manganese transporter [Butyriboletus roseoflavus]